MTSGNARRAPFVKPHVVEHLLNRAAFGPRRGDVADVTSLGVDRWIEQQLEPARPEVTIPRPPSFATQRDAREWGRRQVQALATAKLKRLVESERQLEEHLADFWFNHFNVFAGKARAGLYLPSYEWETIRPHVLGSFRDLLGATARSPAMLVYLDNAQSTSRGLNENYARELLELHTLGVDGGYAQDDVREVARAFTGWSIDRRSHAFRFAPRLHDSGSKTVLGRRISGSGISEGEQILDMLAHHPSTARHIARKLAIRFVADEPPHTLVERAAARFRDTQGNLREVTRTILTAPEFGAPAVQRGKVKTPLEFLISALRAADSTVELEPAQGLISAQAAMRALQQLGMPLYMCQPPTGYGDVAEDWLSSGSLVYRMNVAIAMGHPEFGKPEFQRR